MFNFFQSILDTISILINFLVNLVTGLIQFVSSLVIGSAYLIETVALLPAPIVGVALTVVAACVIFMLVNR